MHSLITTLGAFLASDKTKVKILKLIYKEIHEKDEEIVGYLQGPFAYAIAITLLSLLAYITPNGMYFAIVPVLLMIFSDTFASFVGKKYGKIKLTFAKNNRVYLIRIGIVNGPSLTRHPRHSGSQNQVLPIPVLQSSSGLLRHQLDLQFAAHGCRVFLQSRQ